MSRENRGVYFQKKRHNIHLRGLSDKAGGDLLKALDTEGNIPTRALRERASATLEGNPLALVLLAKYARRHADDIETLQEMPIGVSSKLIKKMMTLSGLREEDPTTPTDE